MNTKFCVDSLSFSRDCCEDLVVSEVAASLGVTPIMRRNVAIVVKDIAMGAVYVGFNPLSGQIRRSVATASLPLRCFFEAVLSKR